MPLLKRILLLTFIGSSLAACSSFKLLPEQQLNLSTYEEKVFTNCIDSGEYKDASSEEQKTLCEHRAARTVKTAKAYFELYNEDTMASTCGSKELSEQTPCYLDYQKDYYDRAINAVLK